MDALDAVRRMFEHARWADRKILDALQGVEPESEAFHEFAHVLGAAAVWLSRIEDRPIAVVGWPEIDRAGLVSLHARVESGWTSLLDRLTDADLARKVSYTNSAGQHFDDAVIDIVLHVALHAQYHRGKVNRLLREAGREPAPVDYIALVRGAPAPTTPRGTAA